MKAIAPAWFTTSGHLEPQQNNGLKGSRMLISPG
jgi:hypothetical protein